MTDLIRPNRRVLLTGLAAVICAPAIVRASSLMPVKALPEWVVVPPYSVIHHVERWVYRIRLLSELEVGETIPARAVLMGDHSSIVMERLIG